MKNILFVFAIVICPLFVASAQQHDTYHPIQIDTLETRMLGLVVSNRGCQVEGIGGTGGWWKHDPRGILIFQLNPFFYGSKDSSVYASAKLWEDSFSPGPVINGQSAWVSQPMDRERYKTYKLTADDVRNQTERFRSWPMDLGAPMLGSSPCAYGASYVWSVFNDADTTLPQDNFPSRINHTLQPRSGLEFQQTVIATDTIPFQATYPVRSFIARVLAINKSGHDMDSAYLGFWTDVDIGGNDARHYGVDTARQTMFCYYQIKETSDPFLVGIPAIAFVVLQGPVTPVMGKDAHFRERIRKNYANTRIHCFLRLADDSGIGNEAPFHSVSAITNFVHNKQLDGFPYIDPHTGREAPIPFTGDPIKRTGWWNDTIKYGGGGDGFTFACGPFPFAAADTQEIVLGVIVARAETPLGSLAQALTEAKEMQIHFNAGYYDCSESFNEYHPDTSHVAPVYDYTLDWNFPNPVHEGSLIQYSIGGLKGDAPVPVRLELFDALGKKITELVEALQTPGSYTVNWNSAALSSGVYILRLRAGNFSAVKQIVKLK